MGFGWSLPLRGVYLFDGSNQRGPHLGGSGYDTSSSYSGCVDFDVGHQKLSPLNGGGVWVVSILLSFAVAVIVLAVLNTLLLAPRTM